jgi:hypothetical protein
MRRPLKVGRVPRTDAGDTVDIGGGTLHAATHWTRDACLAEPLRSQAVAGPLLPFRRRVRRLPGCGGPMTERLTMGV